MQPDKVDLPVTYQAYRENQKRRIQMRRSNLQEHEDDFFGGTKKTSQIKTIQKFITKLKADNKNHETILAELQTLNMAKYLEQVSNIVANSVNEKQIVFYVQISSKLNTSYENVPSIMIKDLSKIFNASLQSPDDTRNKLKSIFLFVAELFVCGFSFSYKQVIEMLKKIFKSGKNKKSNHASELEGKLFIYWYSSYAFVSFLINFAEIFTKRTPQWISQWQSQKKQTPKFPEVIPIKMKQQLTFFFSKYTTECFALLKEVSEKIKEYEEELLQCLKMEGQFNKQTEKNYNYIIDKFVATRQNLKIIAQGLSEAIDQEILDIKITPTPEIIAKYINKAENAEIYEDQFQKQIYENIPDLFEDNEQKNTPEELYKEFKTKLDNCKNVADSNEIAKQFGKINNKKNRKMLAKDILQYRKEYHLVTPYLCRVIGMIHKKHKDIGQYVNEMIFNEYQKLKENSNNTFVINDKKSRYFKYICEFTKFGVIQPQKTMNCIQFLIENLNGYNIQLIVSVLQNVGRYLHLTESSANRFTFLMNKYENVIKKKSLPIFTTSQLINSISLLKPRKQSQKAVKRQLTQYELLAEQAMQMCILDDIDEIINKIDELSKTKEGLEALRETLMKKIQCFDFLNNYNYAYLLQELQQPQLSNFVVDRTIQKLCLCLVTGQSQKTILWSKFFAQLYKYKLLERSLLFATIYNIMKVTANPIGVINSVCNILEACIGYLSSKKVSKNNEKFMLLVDFRRFISKCAYIPMLQQFEIIQIFDHYEPQLADLQISLLQDFLKQCDEKMKKENRECDYTSEFDKFLQKKNMKKKDDKKIIIEEGKQYREKAQDLDDALEKDKKVSEENKAVFIQESKAFDKQLVDIMELTRKQYLSRIAKPVYLEKNIEKRKEKKKSGSHITIIGRSGNRFVRKDIPKDPPSDSKQ